MRRKKVIVVVKRIWQTLRKTLAIIEALGNKAARPSVATTE